MTMAIHEPCSASAITVRGECGTDRRVDVRCPPRDQELTVALPPGRRLPRDRAAPPAHRRRRGLWVRRHLRVRPPLLPARPAVPLHLLALRGRLARVVARDRLARPVVPDL